MLFPLAWTCFHYMCYQKARGRCAKPDAAQRNDDEGDFGESAHHTRMVELEFECNE